MLKLLLAVPAVILSFVWSLFFPARHPVAPPPTPPVPDPDAPSEESQKEGHEVTDASAKTVGLFVLALFVVIFTAMTALGVMYKRMYADTQAIPVPPIEQSFKNAPQDKTSIAKDWETIDRSARERLDGYGWTDQAHRFVRVPIARAMALVVREGLPARAGQTPDFPPPEQEKLPLMELESTTDATKFDPHQ